MVLRYWVYLLLLVTGQLVRNTWLATTGGERNWRLARKDAKVAKHTQKSKVS